MRRLNVQYAERIFMRSLHKVSKMNA